VPALLDAIVAKMIAKALEERYQDAAEAARDLRECERQVAGAATQPPAAAGAATTLQKTQAVTLPNAVVAPTQIDAEVKSAVLGQTIDRSRLVDRQPAEALTASATDAPPARGLAPTFNSAEATQRLATLTGSAATMPPAGATPQTATQAVKSLASARVVWRQRDWALVGGAALCGLLAALLLR
jgi:hypothetical protein